MTELVQACDVDWAIPIRIPLHAVARAEDHAAKACVGGQSSVRGSDRGTELYRDQVVGQLGQVALHLYWYGNLHLYETGRWMQNQFPKKGDGGYDIPGAMVDVKASLRRTKLLPVQHRLLVRPAERHAEAVYVLAIVEPELTKVTLVGWAADAQLPPQPDSEGPFAGAHVVPGVKLWPLLPIRYAWGHHE